MEDLLADVKRYYGRQYRRYGDSAQGMDWKDRGSQYLRFERIARHVDWSRTPSILDVGCGNGELLAFCRDHGLTLSTYLGLDVCEEMVEACRRRFGPEVAALGATAELRSWGRDFDYVVASGTFNVKQDVSEVVWQRHLHRSVREMFDACRVATVWNVMTSLVDTRYDRLYYAGCDEMAELAAACGTRRFVIDHNYPLFEMTLAFFREPAGEASRG